MLQAYVTVSSNINDIHYLCNTQKRGCQEFLKHAVKRELYLSLLIM